MTETLIQVETSAEVIRRAKGFGTSTAVMTATTIVTGVANYGMALVMARLLDTDEFSRFAAGQSLLLVMGIGAMAALPWAVSHYLSDAQSERDPSKALHFGLVGAAVQALALGALAFAVSFALDGPGFALALFISVAFISLLSGPVGFFQGQADIVGIAFARLLETTVRICAGLLLVLFISRSAVFGLLGFATGSAAALTWLMWRARSAFPLRRPARTVALRLGRQALLLGAIQVLLSMLGALDTVYVAAGHFDAVDAASYQSAAIIGRIPLFISSALAIVTYTSLVKAQKREDIGRIIRSCLVTYAWVVTPIAIMCATVPPDIFYSIVPGKYRLALSLLRITVLTGSTVGFINVLTTAHQARGRFRNGIGILVLGAILQAVVLLVAGRFLSVGGYAVVALGVLIATSLALGVDARSWLHSRPRSPIALTLVTILAVITAVMRGVDLMWVIASVALTGLCLYRAYQSVTESDSGRHRREVLK